METNNQQTEQQVQNKEEIIVNENEDIVKKEELTSGDKKELNSLKKEFRDFKKNIVKSLVEKYNIYADVDMKKLNFNSLNDLEFSILDFCEKRGISYKKPQITNVATDSHVITENKKGFYL